MLKFAAVATLAIFNVNAINLAAEDDEKTLQSLALKHDILFGAMIDDKYLYDEDTSASYREIFEKQYNIATPGNPCKPHQIIRTEDNYELDRCIAAHAETIAAGQKMRGHALVWGVHNHKWFDEKEWTKKTLLEFMRTYIFTVMQGVKEANGNEPIYAWDVVNEAVGWINSNRWHKKTGKNGLKENTWSTHIPNYMDYAFTYAKEADPDTLLFYNDYQITQDSSRAYAIQKQLRKLIKRGVPIDGVGMQMHHKDVNALSTRQTVSDVIKLFGDLGLQVHITEMTIACPECDESNADYESYLERQASGYAAALAGCLDNPGVCTAFLTWGFTDNQHHYGENDHPMLWDKEYKPKPAYYKLMEVLENYPDIDYLGIDEYLGTESILKKARKERK